MLSRWKSKHRDFKYAKVIKTLEKILVLFLLNFDTEQNEKKITQHEVFNSYDKEKEEKEITSTDKNKYNTSQELVFLRF